ncbi:hypothetical protein [Nocardia carnea]|uniref:Uncharacterized protein n=1 Tax=Nocardia carnea TaxID=37328 RepID=A0ABW7TJM9_9NOCA|nr:hypothetical protein [Nocardia carnea]
MAAERDECRVIVDGVAPSVVVLLRKAAQLAADHGRRSIGIDDLHAAMIAREEAAPLWWPRPHGPRFSRNPGSSRIMYATADGAAKPLSHGILQQARQGVTVPLTFEQYRDLILAWVPGPTPDDIGPASPTEVTYELSGPHADEFRKMIEQQSRGASGAPLDHDH